MIRAEQDYSAAVETLLHRGYTQRAIARETHVSVSTVNRWRNSVVCPRYGAGELLFMLALAEPEPPT